MNCPTCGQHLPNPLRDPRVTPRELEIVSAWWLLHSVRATARFFGISEQTVKNHLYNARVRNGVHTSASLARLFMADLAPMESLLKHLEAVHNVEARKRERAA